MNQSDLFFGIPISHMFLLLVWVLGALIAGKLLQVVIRRASRAKHFSDRETLQVFFVALARPIPFLFLVIGLRLGLSPMPVSAGVQAFI